MRIRCKYSQKRENVCVITVAVCVCVFALETLPHPEGLKEGREGKAKGEGSWERIYVLWPDSGGTPYSPISGA